MKDIPCHVETMSVEAISYGEGYSFELKALFLVGESCFTGGLAFLSSSWIYKKPFYEMEGYL